MERERKPGFNEVCEACGKDLHACLNCRFYSPGMRWDCSESAVQEKVADKESRNHCDWFETRAELLVAGPGRASARTAADRARDELGKLFGS